MARRRVVAALQELFPLELAENKWDNVGLLIEPPKPPAELPGDLAVVLLTNDLTEPVLAEAIERGARMIVTYHPRPFSGLKRFGPQDTTQRIVMSCIQHDIWVYSPHTASDNAAGGVNDWLARCAGGDGATVVPVEPFEGREGAGRGRIATCSAPEPLSSVLDRIKSSLGVPSLRFAPSEKVMAGRPTPWDAQCCLDAARDTTVSTVAVQAGSGSSVLEGVDADLWVTGEMSHHQVLAANAIGVSVVLTEHSNSERAFLREVQEKLASQVPEAEFLLSSVDCDPLRAI